MILGDFGAEVLKIEEPPVGDARIGMSPSGDGSEREAAYSALNRNKRSMILNLRAAEGRQVFYKLAERSDVILEGFRPGVVKRLAVDYETVSKLNPGIIYCSVSGYGQGGPYKELPGHDINYIAVAGALGLIGDIDGHPVIPLNLLGDSAGSLGAVTGILLALVARARTGKGQHVDVAMTDGVIALLTMVTEQYFSRGLVPKRGEVLLADGYPYYGAYETKDGKYICIGCIEPSLWRNLCRELGREDFADYCFKPEHAYQKPDSAEWKEIYSYLRQVFLTKTRDEWFELLWQKNIPISRVYSLHEVFSDPQIVHREMVMELNHPVEGNVKQVGFHLKLEDTPAKFRTFAPLLGQHTIEVLAELGYPAEEIAELRRKDVIG